MATLNYTPKPMAPGNENILQGVSPNAPQLNPTPVYVPSGVNSGLTGVNTGSYSSPLASTSIPAAAVTATPKAVVPTSPTVTPPATNNIVGSTAWVNSLSAQLEAAKAQAMKIQAAIPGMTPASSTATPTTPATPASTLETEQNKAETESKTWFDKVSDYVQQLTGAQAERPNVTEAINTEMDKYGVADQMASLNQFTSEAKAFRDEYNTVNAEKIAALEALTGQGRGIPQAILEGKAAQIERQYNNRLTSISAAMGARAADAEMVRGNITAARGLIKDTIDAKMYDAESKIKDMESMITLNMSIFERLDTKSQNLLTKQIEQMKLDAENKRKDMEEVGKLHMDNPDAGIDILNDTLAEAQEKVAKAGGSLTYRKSQSGGSDSDTPKTEGERVAAALVPFAQRIQSGKPMADGTPILDTQGWLTAKAWKSIMDDAALLSIPRVDLIRALGRYIYVDADGTIPSTYGRFSPEEKALLVPKA